VSNESMADQANPLGGYEGEIASSNGNGVFEAGESGIKFAKDETGLKFGVRLTNKTLFAAVGMITAGVILKHYGARSVAAKSAQKVQSVAEQAEEAATRG